MCPICRRSDIWFDVFKGVSGIYGHWCVKAQDWLFTADFVSFTNNAGLDQLRYRKELLRGPAA